MYNHKIVNTETGEETVIPFSNAETKVMETNIAEVNAELAEAAKKAEARTALLAKLGITAEEAALLF
jgi:hypothetical protein